MEDVGILLHPSSMETVQEQKLATELAKQESLYYADDSGEGAEESDAHLLVDEDEDSDVEGGVETSSAENPSNFQHLGATVLACI